MNFFSYSTTLVVHGYINGCMQHPQGLDMDLPFIISNVTEIDSEFGS